LTVSPNSGELELGDRTTLTDIYTGPYAHCYAAALPRGTFGTGGRSGWVCSKSNVTPDRGTKATLTIVWEAAGSNSGMSLPGSDFDLQAQELYPKIERNSFFSGIATATLALAYSAAQASTPDARSKAAGALAGLTDTTQRTLGQALAAKLAAGAETFYMAGLRYTWWSFSWTVPSLSLGGTIATPDGPLTGYFGTISFVQLADTLSPVGVNGSIFKKTKTFLGGHAGHWDSDLY
jgi:uncharacterized protein (DUF2147 family)